MTAIVKLSRCPLEMYIMDLSAMCGEVRGREEILPITGKDLNFVNGPAVYGKHPDGKPPR